MKYKWKR